MAALHLPSHIQTWLLYHNALSDGVVLDDVVKFARKSREKAGVEETKVQETIESLMKRIDEQDRQLELLRKSNKSVSFMSTTEV